MMTLLITSPELVACRTFIRESAQQLDSGEVERLLLGMRSQIAPGGTPRSVVGGAGDDAEVDAALRRRAALVIPQHFASPESLTLQEPILGTGSPLDGQPFLGTDGQPPQLHRSYKQYVRLTAGPVILLHGAKLSHELIRTDREGAAVYVLMWVVDSLDRCVIARDCT
jgi:hypothetical protein